MNSDADIVGYGGQAGGGKSDAELGIALMQHRRSIIFRREYPNLKGLLARSRQIIGRNGRYNGTDHMWTLGGGKTLEFGSVQYADSVDKYQGQPHDYIGFDEVQHFLESQVRFLLGWMRSTEPGQRCRCVMTFNPPTSAEGLWIIDFFAPWLKPGYKNPAQPGELRWFAMMDGEETEVPTGEPFEHKGETIQPLSRTFIRAELKDNPALDRTGYRATLQALPEPLRSQMLFGDFTAGSEDHTWQVFPLRWVQAAMERHKAGKPQYAVLTGLGVDVACGGNDRTVLAPRYRSWFDELMVYPGRETPDGQTVAAKIILALGGSTIMPNVDTIGVGQGARTALDMSGVRFNEFNAAAGSFAKDRSGLLGFYNLKAEAYWKFREALDPESGVDIALPDDRELLAELCAPRWRLTAHGIQMEPKDLTIARLGRSPDKAEAVILSWFEAERVSVQSNPWEDDNVRTW